MNKICPFCDSNNVDKIEIDETVSIPFCDDVIISHQTFRCNDCEEEGDFDNSLDKALTKAIDKANNLSASTLMKELTHKGITMTYLEKALRLPFRTTTRWKRGEISRSALALLRLIRFSPRLLEVADENFSPEAIARYQLSRTWDFFENNTIDPGCTITSDMKQFCISFQGEVQRRPSSIQSLVTQKVEWVTA